jgi:hypothetical protein
MHTVFYLILAPQNLYRLLDWIKITIVDKMSSLIVAIDIRIFLVTKLNKAKEIQRPKRALNEKKYDQVCQI